MLGKVFFAPTPIHPEVFGEKRRHHHPQAVVHVTGLIDLGHGGIDQWIACTAFAPSCKQGLAVGTVVPLNLIVLGLEAAFGHMRKVGQNLGVKVAPYQLGQPDTGAFAGFVSTPCLQSQLANGHSAKTQVHTQIAGAFDGWKVAGFFVAVDAVQEVFN